MKLQFVFILFLYSFGYSAFSQGEGCMNPYACNYDSLATIDNGSCVESILYKSLDFGLIPGYIDIAADAYGNYYNVLNVIDTLQLDGFVAPPDFYNSIGYVNGVYNSQGIVMKFTMQSELLWSIPIYSDAFDGVYQIDIDSLDNLYIAGTCGHSVYFGTNQYLSTNQSDYNGFVTKINSNGEIQWIRFFENTGNQGVGNLTLGISGNGNVILTGLCYGDVSIEETLYSFNPGFVSYWDTNGNLVHIVNGPSIFMPSDLSSTGNSVICNYGGSSYQLGGYNYTSSSITSYNSNYDLTLQLELYGNDGSYAQFNSVKIIDNGDFVVTLSSYTDTLFVETPAGMTHLVNPNFIWDSVNGVSNNLGSSFIVRFSSLGEVIWHKDYFGTGNIWANDIYINDSRGEFVMVADFALGSDFEFDNQTILNPGYYNFLVAKYDLNGNLLYLETSNTTTTSSSVSAAIDNYGQIKAIVRVENEVQIGDVLAINPDPSNIPTTGGQWGILTIGYSNELGCTDSFACNYNPGAGCDNGTCLYPGCTDATACNYNSFAGCDDGLCDYHLVDIAPPICLVTVDEVSGHNMIVWEVPTENQIDQYLVFKETNVLNNYIEIGQVSVNDLGEFIDVNSNPQVQANKYKLAVIDSCGATSEKCESHKTVHLSANFGIGGVINLAWTNYEGLSFSSYNIYRGNSTLGFNIIGSVPSNQTSFTDISPSSVEYVYYIEVGDISCNSDRTIVSSKSNYLNTNPDNIHSSSGVSYFNVYCSVSNGILHLSASEAEVGREFSVLNSTGSLVYSGRVLGSQSQHDLSGLSNGVYVFRSGEYSKQFMLLK